MAVADPQESASLDARAGTPAGLPGKRTFSALWLLLIVVLAFGLRAWYINDDLQLDEFGPLYAIAERANVPAGMMPAASDPLVAVQDWQQVRERSILPFGIVHPIPLYHYLLYVVEQVCPITEWSLRLPSLLAGVGCVVGMYFLCRRLASTQVALAAALLTAVDPTLVQASVIARPYAIGDLACVGTFYFLLLIRQSSRVPLPALGAAGYGVCLALLGYLNPVLLVVGTAHAGLVLYWFFRGGTARVRRLGWWLAGCALALVLLAPLFPYIMQVRRFTSANLDYLQNFSLSRLYLYYLLTGPFLLALLIVTAGSYLVNLVARSTSSGERATSPPTGEPAEETDLVWLGRMWFFLPLGIVFVLSYAVKQPTFLPRYLTYTSLGGILLLAYWCTRVPGLDVRLGLTLAAAFSLLVWGLSGLAPSVGTPSGHQAVAVFLDRIDEVGHWHEGDVLLYQSGFLEADLLRYAITDPNRAYVEGALLAPLRTLYAAQRRRPVMLLTWGQYRNDKIHTVPGEPAHMEAFYNEDWERRARSYQRFWILTRAHGRTLYLECFLPRLADLLGTDLKVARNRPGDERYFTVEHGKSADGHVPGLSPDDSQPFDFFTGPPEHFPIGMVQRQPLKQPSRSGADQTGAGSRSDARGP